MSNRITIELCQEDRERLDLLTSTLIALGGELTKHSPATLNIDLKPVTPAEEEHPVDAVVPHADPVGDPGDPGEPGYTKDDVLAKVQQLAAPNDPKREQAKAIVKSYGAKVSDIPADKYAEVMAKLAELEG